LTEICRRGKTSISKTPATKLGKLWEQEGSEREFWNKRENHGLVKDEWVK